MNDFDKLLGRKGELVELRKEQVLTGAMNIIQKHYADKQNKMEAVAQLLGKNLGEEFLLKTDKNAVFDYMFDNEGLWYLTEHRKSINDHKMLLNLLTGKAVILD